MSIVQELADGKSVLVDGSGSEALIGHVEEGVQLPLLDDLGELLPLFGLGINARGVVSAGMQQDHALLRDFL